MNYRRKYILIHLAAAMAIFSLARLSLLILHYDFFASLSLSEKLIAMFDGMRFDLSILLTFLGLPYFLLALPLDGKNWIKTFALITNFLLLCIVFVLIGDIIFFDEVKRHLGDELILTLRDFNFIVFLAFTQYWYLFILLMAVLFFGVRATLRSIDKRYVLGKLRPLREIFIQALIIVLMIIGIRGTFGHKPINVINAFGQGSSEYGNLVLNGVFTTYHVSRKSSSMKHQYYDDSDAIRTAQKMIIGSDELVTRPDYPLERRRVKFQSDSLRGGQQFNVVFFLLESWTPDYIDCYSGKNYGVTPNFDTLASKGLMFTNFYANGDRSIYGITSTMLAITQPLGLPYLGTGLEVYNLFRMGRLFNSIGYNTLMGQASHRGSFRMNVIAQNLGFRDYYGMEDPPKAFSYETNEVPIFGWDYEPMMYMENKVSHYTAPFYSYLFTGTTHMSYVLPAKRFGKYPHNKDGINGYLNTLYYSDWALGEFFARAKQEPWFNNTIFVFVADHVNKFVGNSEMEHLRIPCLIYCPSLFPPAKIGTLGSQADLPATIIDLAGIRAAYSGIGKSLLSDYAERFVIFNRGNYVGIITPEGWMKHDLKTRLDYSLNDGTHDENKLSAMEKKLLSIDQTIFRLFKQNKFYRE